MRGIRRIRLLGTVALAAVLTTLGIAGGMKLTSSSDTDSAGAAAGEPSLGTATFTFTNTATATYPVPTVTETSTVTVTQPPTTTAPPPTTTTTPPTTTTTPPATLTANAWVDTNGGSGVRKAAPAGYVDSDAFGSFNAAYQAAECGDVIGVKDGVYASQTIDVAANKTSCTNHVRFSVIPGETVRMGSSNNGSTGNALTICANYVRFDGTTSRQDALAATASNPTGVRDGFDIFSLNMSLCTGPIRQPHHIILTDVSVNKFAWTGARDIAFNGGQVGPLTGCGPSNNEDMLTMKSRNSAYSGNGQNYPLTNVTIDGAVFHDLIKAGCANHMDMVQAYTGVNVTIKNTQFLRSGDQILFGRCELECSTAIPMTGWVIDNNYFDAATVTPNALALVSAGAVPCRSMTVSNNYMAGNRPQLECTNAASGTDGAPSEIQVSGNNFAAAPNTCAWATWTNNVYRSGGGCG